MLGKKRKEKRKKTKEEAKCSRRMGRSSKGTKKGTLTTLGEKTKDKFRSGYFLLKSYVESIEEDS